MINHYAYSDVGLIRPNNEDVWLSFPEHRLFTIADGMGGHLAGEIAALEATHFFSRSALDYIKTKSFTSHELINNLHNFFQKTNEHVYKLNIDHADYRGMGTTLCCLYLHKNHAIYGHVGDSRIYHFQQNKLKQLTQDHSLINRLTKKGCSEKKLFSYRNIITRAIGTGPKVKAEISSVNFFPKDYFLLCTDGLTDYVSAQIIEKILNMDLSLNEKVHLLIKHAKKNKSSDNITIVLIEITENFSCSGFYKNGFRSQ